MQIKPGVETKTCGACGETYAQTKGHSCKPKIDTPFIGQDPKTNKLETIRECLTGDITDLKKAKEVLEDVIQQEELWT